jgi:hypothetical protein
MNVRANLCRWPLSLAIALLVMVAPGPAQGDVTVEVDVPGSADPWLAGMPDGASASCCPGGWGCSHAPMQSPPLAAGLCLLPEDALTFEVGGATAQDPSYPLLPPDGGVVTLHHAYDENGLSDLLAPISCLTGVFLDDLQPDLGPAPAMLDFSTPESRDYLSLAPELKQIFFIGDGRTSSGELQEVLVPAGATRLFLGNMDCCDFMNNIGVLAVVVSDPCGLVASKTASWSTVKALFP